MDNYYDYMGFYFRGLHKDIEELVGYYKKKNKWPCMDDVKKISDKVSEVCIYGEQNDELVQNFPKLKVVVFVEDWSNRSCSVWFSDCNTTKYEKVFVDYFDGHDEDRWTLKNPTKNFRAKQLYINCGETARINYTFPFKNEWDKEDYE